MIKIENTVISNAFIKAAIDGARNPMNSWNMSDSTGEDESYVMGEKDHALAMRLANAGKDHRKYMRMIPVTVDVTAPLYWWKEYDTYKVGTVANSTSTMHKIQAKEFVLDDFSHEHLTQASTNILVSTIGILNFYREEFLKTNNKENWWQMIQLLPSSYNQKRTLFLNYEVLANMYHARKNHKLDEWHVFCDWVKTLPYSELITGEREYE